MAYVGLKNNRETVERVGIKIRSWNLSESYGENRRVEGTDRNWPNPIYDI